MSAKLRKRYSEQQRVDLTAEVHAIRHGFLKRNGQVFQVAEAIALTGKNCRGNMLRRTLANAELAPKVELKLRHLLRHGVRPGVLAKYLEIPNDRDAAVYLGELVAANEAEYARSGRKPRSRREGDGEAPLWERQLAGMAPAAEDRSTEAAADHPAADAEAPTGELLSEAAAIVELAAEFLDRHPGGQPAAALEQHVRAIAGIFVSSLPVGRIAWVVKMAARVRPRRHARAAGRNGAAAPADKPAAEVQL